MNDMLRLKFYYKHNYFLMRTLWCMDGIIVRKLSNCLYLGMPLNYILLQKLVVDASSKSCKKKHKQYLLGQKNSLK